MKTFLIMKEVRGYYGVTYDTPHALFNGTRKEANALIEKLNAKAISNTYWIKSIKTIN